MNISVQPAPPPAIIDTLTVTTLVVRHSRLSARMIVPRSPGVARLARALAAEAGLEVSINLTPGTVRVHYASQPGNLTATR
jgi:hypothetical protein